MAHDLDVDWSESISAIETEDSVIFFTDANAPHLKETEQNSSGNASFFEGFTKPNDTISNLLCRRQLGGFSTFFPCGNFLYSLTAHNPMNLPQSDDENEAGNRVLLKDLEQALPGCKIWENFSYFPDFPHNYEKGFTVVVPEDSPQPHGRIIRQLSIKYRQAAYFRCRLSKNGRVSQKLIFPHDLGNETELKLVVIGKFSFHPDRSPLCDLSNAPTRNFAGHDQGVGAAGVNEFLNFCCQFSLPTTGHEFQFPRLQQGQVDGCMDSANDFDSSPFPAIRRSSSPDYSVPLGHSFNGESYASQNYLFGTDQMQRPNGWDGKRRASEADALCSTMKSTPDLTRRRCSVTEWPGEGKSPSSDFIVLLSLEKSRKRVRDFEEPMVGGGRVTMGTFNWMDLNWQHKASPTGGSRTMTVVVKS